MEKIVEQLILALAMKHFYAFTLVMVRMAGLMTIGPVFGQRIVPGNIRILLIFTMAMVITPTLYDQSLIGFHRLDANDDGKLTRNEMPEQLLPRFEKLLRKADKKPDEALEIKDYRYSVWQLELPRNVFAYAWVAVGEFSLGLILGLGVLIVISGLQLAGELIDQQMGLSLGRLSNPGMDISGTISGQFFFLFAVTVLLVMAPSNGHLLMVISLVETFQSLPVGEAYVTASTVDLLQVLMQQSLVLAIQVAAPILACMSLVALTIGFLGRSVPQLNILVIGFPIRASISLLVLAMTISGAAEVIVHAIPESIDALRQSLTGLP